jgi:hypothetical protein
MIKIKLYRKFLLLLTIICFVNVLYSQKKYNYNEYFLPELNIKGLAFYGFGNYINSNDESNYREGQVESEMEYFHFENTPTTQRYSDTDLRLNYENRRNFTNVSNNITRISGNSVFYQEFRKFLKPNKRNSFFWEINQYISINFSNNYDNLINNNISNSVNSEMAFPVRFGKGRIESLEGLATAEFLIDDLINEGLSDSLLSQEKLFELAQKLVTLQNERVFDNRRARIYRLTEASKWLEENGMISDIKSFTILNDNMNFVSVGNRWQGSAHSIGLFPVIDPLFLLAEPEYGFGLILSHNWEKHINISKNWYHRGSVTTAYNYVKQPVYLLEQTGILSMRAQYQINYMPNTRTLVYVRSVLNGLYADKNHRYWSSFLDIQFNWFINYRMSVSGGFSFDFISVVADFEDISVPGFGPIYRNAFSFYYPDYPNVPSFLRRAGDRTYRYFNLKFNYFLF